MEIFADLGVDADVGHVTDPARIASFGLVATPALVINGRTVVSGYVPGRALLAARISAALDELGRTGSPG